MAAIDRVIRGSAGLGRFLAGRCSDFRRFDPDDPADLAGFRDWLEQHLGRWRGDPAFAQQRRISDLRAAHPEVRALEREYRRTLAEDRTTAAFPRLRDVERRLTGASKAVTGLTAALRRHPERAESIRAKLGAFEERITRLTAEHERLNAENPVRQRLVRIEAELADVRLRTGLGDEEARLAALQTRHGRRAGLAGRSFEVEARAITGGLICPDLERDPAVEPPTVEPLRVLTGVKLGAARVEFDQLVVRLGESPGAAVDVLAVVEVKRNVNDLAHGYRRRVENLAWLTGQAGLYADADYRTREFRTGRFDRDAIHREADTAYRFSPASFRRFGPLEPHTTPPHRLYLVAQAGPVWGVSGAGLAKIRHRLATDERQDPMSPHVLREFLVWAQGLLETIEAPDVIRLYAGSDGGGLILVDPA